MSLLGVHKKQIHRIVHAARGVSPAVPWRQGNYCETYTKLDVLVHLIVTLTAISIVICHVADKECVVIGYGNDNDMLVFLLSSLVCVCVVGGGLF